MLRREIEIRDPGADDARSPGARNLAEILKLHGESQSLDVVVADLLRLLLEHADGASYALLAVIGMESLRGKEIADPQHLLPEC